MKHLGVYLDEAFVDLQYHDELNPKLWEADGHMRPIVRDKLLKFAEVWRISAKIPEDAATDVIATGGNVNYNYTPKSDIDVHLIIDPSKMEIGETWLEDWLYDKKLLWTLTHNVKVLGYPLEPYAQDEAQVYHVGQGVYSLMHDAWIQKPQLGKFNWSEDPNLEQKVEYYAQVITDLIKQKMGRDAIDTLKTRIREMRSAGIQRGGEFSFENLVFKALRNGGFLDKMNSYERRIVNRDLSLREESTATMPFEGNPKVGWWKSQKHMTVYHGTHDDNVQHILKHGLNHADPTSGMVSVTHDPHTAHGYAAMSASGGEHHFRKAGGSPTNTPHDKRSVVKMKIPMSWASRNMDQHLRGNIGQAQGKMHDESKYNDWKSRNPGRPDHEYYQTTEVRMKKAIPSRFVVGIMKKTG